MRRPTRTRIVQVAAAASAVVLALLVVGHAFWSGATGSGSAGSELYATPGGVVWSFTPAPHLGQVARSTDGGRTWHVVLPGPGPHQGLGLSGSFFLGPDLGWVVYQHLGGKGTARGPYEITSIMGTSDGGQHWWRSPPLPGAGIGCCGSQLGYTLYFSDAQHGWLYGMSWNVQGDMVWEADEQLWQTSDGGHTWSLVHGHLPLQGTTDQDDEICPDEGPFQVGFANQQDGWLTASSCATIGSAPRVWRTTDGGISWTPAALPPPPRGWPTARDTYSGVSVGRPWVVGSELLVAVRDPSLPAGLDIETSSDGGQSWRLTSRVSLTAARYASPSWFQPVDASHWVVDAPGEVINTSDAGRTWSTVGRGTGPMSGSFWFSSPSLGYARAPGGGVRVTRDGGRTWSAGTTPPSKRPAAGPAIRSVQQLSPTYAVASGPGGIRVSRDGGRTWARLTAGPGSHAVRSVQFVDPDTGFAVDDIGKPLWRTTDGGRTWTALSLPPRVQADHVQFLNPVSGVAITRQHSVFLSTTGGNTWRAVSPPHEYAPGSLSQERDGYQYACFAGSTADWLVGASLRSPGLGSQSVFVSPDAGTRWRQVLGPATLHSGRVNAIRAVWLTGCRGSQAWVADAQGSYDSSGAPAYDLLHTTDSGKTWQDVLRVQNGTKFPPLALPRSPGALGSSALPAGLSLTPESLALASASDAWQTFVAPGGGLAFAVTADDGQHWQFHWFSAPRHSPRTAPASPSVLPAGLPWLATTATDAQHAWVLFGSTNGSGDCYLFATADGGATWQRITTFR
jgi:photosystem II stability/assembly factor-like uncharacterized protein